MRRFVAAFFRHPFTLILPTILIPLVVVFLVRSLASSYTSEATIFITNNPYVTISAGTNSPYNTPAQNLQNSIMEYLTHNSFVVNVANHTDMPKTYKQGTPNVAELMAQRIKAGLSITAIGNETLDIQYSDPDPHVAAQVITALLQQYLTQSIQDAEALTQSSVAFYQQKLKDDEAQLKADDLQVQQYIQDHPNVDPTTDSTLAVLQSTYQNDLDQVKNDQQQLQKLHSSAGIISSLYTFEVTDPPTIPITPTVKSKTTLTAMIGGVALGLGVSLGLIGLLAVADRRIHSRDDLVEAFPLPVLEVVPQLRGLQEETPLVGSEETLAHLSQVPVLATLPRFTESGGAQAANRALSTRAEDEE
jgi:uncharacterized protein involved in exopolysaccharide biosynthesis